MNFPAAYSDIERLHGTGDGVAARAKDAGGRDVFLKTMGADLFWEEAVGAAEIEKKFETAKLREQAAAAAEPEIFVTGQLERLSGEQVYWVRPFLPGTLRDWVAFKEVPSSRRLAAVCLALARGVAALIRLDGGGHGNLTLSNVLVDGKGQGQSLVRLVDPLQADASSAAADKRALGLIIYQLVRSEFIELDAALTRVADDEDWQQQLGAAGAQWKALCSDLLDPYSALSQADWDEIATRIQTIGSGRRSRNLIVVVSLLLAGGVAAAVFFLIQREDWSVTVDRDQLEQQWVEVLDNYFTWARPLIESRRAFTAGGRAEARFADSFDPAGSFAPAKIDSMLGEIANLGALLSRNPEQARQILQAVKVLELPEADQEQIVRIHRYLSELRALVESWEVLAALKQSRQDFAASGFEFGEAQMKRLLEQIDFSKSFTYRDLFELRTGAAEVAGLQAAHARYEQALSQLEAQDGSVFMRDYAGHLRRQLLEPMTNPSEFLQRLALQADEVVRLWQNSAPTLREDLFQAAEADFIATAPLGQDGVVEEWAQVLSAYKQMNRDVLEQPLLQRKSAAQLNLSRLEAEIEAVREPGMEIPDFQARLRQVSLNYQDAVPQVWIEKNRSRFERAAAALESEIQQLESSAEQLLVELSPDVAAGLLALRNDRTAFDQPLLQAKWTGYRESLFAGKTENSFSSAREFIRFRRNYQQQRERLVQYQQEQLQQLRMTGDLSAELAPEALNQAGRDFLQLIRQQAENAFVAESVDWLFLQDVPATRIASELKQAQQNVSVAADDLQAYLRELHGALDDFALWREPAEGFAELIVTLNASERRKAWSEDSRIRPLLANFRRAAETIAAPADVLLPVVLATNGADFIRFIALSRFADVAQVNVAQLEQLRGVVGELGAKIPPSQEAAWQRVTGALWLTAFSGADTAMDKTTAMRSRDAFGVDAADLSGKARYAFELFSAIELVETSLEQYEKNPAQLIEILNSFKTLPDSVARNSAESLVASLGAIDVSGDSANQPNMPFLERGWRIVEQTEDRMVLEWSGHRKTFYRVSAPVRDFFICESELSIQLFSDWMGQNGNWERFEEDIPEQWRRFVRQRYNPSPRFDERMGLRLWDPPRAGFLKSPGLQRPAAWFGGFDSLAQEEFSQGAEAVLAPPSALSFELPMQHLGAKLAGMFADSMGMRLPSKDEWRATVGAFGDQREVRSWSESWSALVAEPLLEEMQRGSFYSDAGIAASGSSRAEGQLLLAVSQGGGSLRHLAGNVAEFLYEPDEARYYVAGGSALAQVATTWTDAHLLRPSDESRSYSDVGLRVCFDAPVKSPPLQYLNLLQAEWENL